jgi:hypothetical protein
MCIEVGQSASLRSLMNAPERAALDFLATEVLKPDAWAWINGSDSTYTHAHIVCHEITHIFICTCIRVHAYSSVFVYVCMYAQIQYNKQRERSQWLWTTLLSRIMMNHSVSHFKHRCTMFTL